MNSSTTISHAQFFEKWFDCKKRKPVMELLNYVLEIIGHEVDHKALECFVRLTCFQSKQRWEECNRFRDRFSKKNSTWLAKKIDLSKFLLVNRPTNPKIKKRVSPLGHVNGTSNQGKIKSLLSPDQALAMVVEAKLTKRQYFILRRYSPQLYPRYQSIKKAMQLCYPVKIAVNEKYVSVNLQSLIKHTVTRLCDTLEKDLLNTSEIREVTFIFKWGCYGSDPEEYTQELFKLHKCDVNLFSTSVTPIEMYSTDGIKKNVIWKLPESTCTRYCRPIRMMFTKGNNQLICEEVEYIQNEIAELKPIIIKTDTMNLIVNPKLISSTSDGRLCNALNSYTPLNNCYICGAPPEYMNKMKDYDKNMPDSRVKTNVNILQRLLISSDPYICSLRLDPEKIDYESDYESE